MSRHFNFKPLPAAIAIALGSGIAVQPAAHADSVLFPLVRSGGGFITFIQLNSTTFSQSLADFSQSATTVLNPHGADPYDSVNLDFVFNGSNELDTDGTVTCQHADLPGRTSDKDTMFFEVTSGTDENAMQLLPDDPATRGEDQSVAPRITGGAFFGSLAVTNARPEFIPRPGGFRNDTEGTIFGQAWVVDVVNGVMLGYNGYNDPQQDNTPLDPTPTSDFSSSLVGSFNPSTANEYLLSFLPQYSGLILSTYWMFPTPQNGSYLGNTPPNGVTVRIGNNLIANGRAVNAQDVAGQGQNGVFDNKELLISGTVDVGVPCGGIPLTPAQLLSGEQFTRLQHTGGLAYATVLAPRVSTQSTALFQDAALVLKEVSVTGGLVSLFSEPGVKLVIQDVANTIGIDSQVQGSSGLTPTLTPSYTH